MKKGIYTLANDVVFDQLVALLNSIRANYSKDIPVCVIPYDDRMDKVKEEIKTRKNVFIFEDGKCIKKWEALGKKIWDVYSKDMPENQNIFGRHSIHLHRKFCIFDGPFEEFAFLDADTLIMNSIEPFFKKLKTKKFISYDYQYTDLSHVYNINSKKLFEIFNQNRINSEIFCVGFFVSKKTLFSPKDIKKIMRDIKEEYDILYSRAPEQSLLNYMIMKLNIKNYNFALELPKEKATGNCIGSKFEEKNNILYDMGVRLTYLHYIGLPSKVIEKVCSGENLDFPYRDLFLHYRFLHEPEKMPKFKGKPKPYNPKPSIFKIAITKSRRILQKLSKTFK